MQDARKRFPERRGKANKVDVAYVKNNRMWPVEVKWTTQLRSNELKQISKYKNGQIYARVKQNAMINQLPILPLSLALAILE